jgi:hypothetical protein
LSRIIQQKAALGSGYLAYRGHIVYETEEVGGDDAEKAIVWEPLQARMVNIESLRVDVDREYSQSTPDNSGRD